MHPICQRKRPYYQYLRSWGSAKLGDMPQLAEQGHSRLRMIETDWACVSRLNLTCG
ncbi:hypothetical protein SBA3_1510017 [Candidatus Sulfopaludibacter sp. SbA3]|nr:hypothetical protein SBA3_1510017 [Candidatus Sulfopaludibacter sp. SbA3]